MVEVCSVGQDHGQGCVGFAASALLTGEGRLAWQKVQLVIAIEPSGHTVGHTGTAREAAQKKSYLV